MSQPAAGSGEAAPVAKDEYDARWSQLWDAGLKPGDFFDLGEVAPALRDLISGALPVKGRRFFVPGCGRGYDVVAAAAAGASAAVGLDLSATAVAEARRHCDQAAPPEVAARAQFVQGDFFTFRDPGGPFDFGYDYTFLCALHPSMRRDWAAGWARQLVPGTGELVTMVYPVDPSLSQGPPWPVTPQLYRNLLLPAGFELISLDKIPDDKSHPRRAGREWLGRWRLAKAPDAAA